MFKFLAPAFICLPDGSYYIAGHHVLTNEVVVVELAAAAAV